MYIIPINGYETIEMTLKT